MIDGGARRCYLADALKSYLVDIAEASRRHPAIELGLSPRATLQLAGGGPRLTPPLRVATTPRPTTSRPLRRPALAHRLLLRAGSNARTTAEDTVARVARRRTRAGRPMTRLGCDPLRARR